MEITAKLLGEQPFLKGLAEPHLETLVNAAIPVKFRSGDQIFSEGDPANRFYLPMAGKVASKSPSDQYADEREPVLIENIGEGAVLGWSWLFTPYFWHFDAQAVTPVKAIFFYVTALREKCDEDTGLGYELMKRMNEVIVDRLQATRRKLSEMAQTKPLSR